MIFYLKPFFFIITLALFTNPLAFADVVVDNTLGGPVVQLMGPNFDIKESYGRRSGANLFHSFSTFGLNTGDVATFNGSAGINNIIARVTGGSTSIIKGTIATAVSGGTNLWMINPAGWVFGATSQLNVQGSFHLSTSDSVNFQDGNRYLADPAGLSFFTIADPVGHSFFKPSQANITIDSTSLSLSSTNEISILGGNVSLQDSTITVPGGRILIGSSNSAGDWEIDSNGLKTSNTRSFGAVNIAHSQRLPNSTDSLIITDNTGIIGGGLIQIIAGDTSITNATIEASVFGTQDGGDIKLQNTGDIFLTHSLIEATIFNDGGTGDISIRAANLSMKDQSAIRNRSIFRRNGQLGKINIELSGNLTMQNASTDILATTFGSGRGGDITIQANQIKIFDKAAIRAATFREGNAGNITIQANNINMYSEGTIDSSTVVSTRVIGGGNGGTITINSDTLTLKDKGTVITTASFGAGGNGGKIILNIGDLKLLNDAEIRSESKSGRPAGTISINNRGTFLVDNAQISTESIAADGGRISINSDILVLRNGQITTSVDGILGNGGDINLTTNSLIMDTGFVQANTTSIGGAGGDIQVTTDRIIASQEKVLIGGNQRLVFTANSGINVIQAAAPNGVSGNINVSPVVLDISGDLSTLDSQFLNDIAIKKNPCAVARGQKLSSLVPMGKGGLPYKGNDSLSLPMSSYLTSPQQIKTVNTQNDSNQTLAQLNLACNDLQ